MVKGGGGGDCAKGRGTVPRGGGGGTVPKEGTVPKAHVGLKR